MTEPEIIVRTDDRYIILNGSDEQVVTYAACMDTIAQYVIELRGRGRVFELQPLEKGSLEAYDTMRNLSDLLKRVCEEQDDEPVTPLCS